MHSAALYAAPAVLGLQSRPTGIACTGLLWFFSHLVCAAIESGALLFRGHRYCYPFKGLYVKGLNLEVLNG
jgi:hypothetical protein